MEFKDLTPAMQKVFQETSDQEPTSAIKEYMDDALDGAIDEDDFICMLEDRIDTFKRRADQVVDALIGAKRQGGTDEV